jgi:hypothetical protein
MKKFAGALVVAGALMVPLASPALAAPPPCEPGAPGCKTVDDPTKNNPKFTETQRGNVNAPGTESTLHGGQPGPDQAGLPITVDSKNQRLSSLAPALLNPHIFAWVAMPGAAGSAVTSERGHPLPLCDRQGLKDRT